MVEETENYREEVRDVTYETLKTKLREVLEKIQELSKVYGEDDPS